MKKVFKWFFISLLTIIALGIPTIYLIVLNSPTVSATWYDDSWAYRKRVDVTVASSATDTTNLQMLLTIDTSTSGIASGKMQASCQDLRFTNTNGKVLPYYIDSGCTTTATKVWVMVDLVPKNTTSMTLFMYYGNPSAPQGSNSQPYFDNVVGLVGYWNMNESSWNGTSGEVKDMSVNGNNGTASGNATTTSSGKYSNAGTFDGGGDFVQTSTNIGISGNPSFTIVAWFKATTLGDAKTIARFGDTGTSLGAAGAVVMSNGAVGASFAGGNNAHTAASTISTGTWYHIAIVKTPGVISTTTSVYLNGVLQSLNSPSTNTPNITNGVVNIGRWYSTEDFNGQIDDVKIYNTARTAAQILNDYNNKLPNGQTLTIASTAPTTVVPTNPTYNTEEKAPSPIAYWKFDDGQGTNAQDSTTTNADGTLAGTTVPTWKTEDLCISGKCLYFDGLTSKITVSKVLPSAQTVSLWVRPNTSASTALIDLDGGTHKITTDASSVISATAIPGSTITMV